MQLIVPASHAFTAYRGGTFDPMVSLFKDAKETEPYSLTGWTVRFTVDDVITLTEGNGLSVDEATGVISVVMTAVQTAKAAKEKARYSLTIEKESVVYFVLRGVLTFESS